MTPSDKDKIRQVLSNAAGHDVGEVYPEAFQSANAGQVITAVVQRAGTPYLKTAMIPKPLTLQSEPRNLWFFGMN